MTQSSGDERVQQLLSLERREHLDVYRILSLIPLRPYMTVADVGCGPGLFTISLAKSVWDGKVYAVDVEEEALEAVRQRARQARLGNIVTLKSKKNALPLELDSVDGVLLSCVLHEVPDKGVFLKKVAGALRRTGWCAVIEWRMTAQGDEVPPPERRISEEEALRLVGEVGLRMSLRRELSSYHYMLLLTR